MADEADITQERMEREEALRKRLREYAAAQPAVVYKECRWCGDSTEGGAQFCSNDCSKDWHRHDTALKRNGVRR